MIPIPVYPVLWAIRQFLIILFFDEGPQVLIPPHGHSRPETSDREASLSQGSSDHSSQESEKSEIQTGHN
jgi:hypothetical protein